MEISVGWRPTKLKIEVLNPEIRLTAPPLGRGPPLAKVAPQQQSDALGEGDADRQQRDNHKLPGRYITKGADVARDRAAVRGYALAFARSNRA